MAFENIRQAKQIPYFDQERSLSKSLLVGARSRNINPAIYAFRRLRNYVLLLLAYVSPMNRIRVRLHKLRGVNIGKNVYIGMFCFLDNAYPEYIYIEDNAGVNARTMIITHFNPRSHFKELITATVEPVIIKEGALIAVSCILLPGVIVGIQSIVGAGSVVNKSISDYTIVAGNPARKIIKYKST